MTLSDKMLEYRARHDLTTKAASAKAGISDQTWRYVEKGLQDATALTRKKIELMIEGGEEHEGIGVTD